MYGTGKRGKKAERNNTKMSETYEIIVLDLDGTLTNSKKVITPKTKDALMRIQKEGKKVVLASGRPTGGIVKLADELELLSAEAKFHGMTLTDFLELCQRAFNEMEVTAK